MATIVRTESAKLILTDTEEHELIPAPDVGDRFILTHVEYQNNDSADHTPKIRIKDASDRAAHENPNDSDDTEYTPLTPTGRVIGKSGGVIELTAPIYTLKNVDGAIESLVVEDSAAPTDTSNPPSIKCQWLVEQD